MSHGDADEFRKRNVTRVKFSKRGRLTAVGQLLNKRTTANKYKLLSRMRIDLCNQALINHFFQTKNFRHQKFLATLIDVTDELETFSVNGCP